MATPKNLVGGTLLIVDDEPRIVSSLERVLRPLRLDILSASNAKVALDCLAENEIDVVIADEGLPGIPGTQFLERAKERYPGVVRIMLTGQLDIEVAKTAINDGGIFRFLTKPTDSAELLEAVRQALVHRALLKQMEKQGGRPGADEPEVRAA